jgi:hypothetical protein
MRSYQTSESDGLAQRVRYIETVKGVGMEPFEERIRRGGATAMAEVDRFFMKEGPL